MVSRRLVLIGVALLVGCRSDVDRHRLTGEVRLAGESVSDGLIVFEATDGLRAAVAAPIVAGRYEAWMPAGSNRVRITASRSVPGTEVPDGSGRMMERREDYIPAAFNTATTISLEMPPRDHVHDFDLEPRAGS